MEAGTVSLVGAAHWFQWKRASLHCSGCGYNLPHPPLPMWYHFTSAVSSCQRWDEGAGQWRACAKLFICLFKWFYFLWMVEL